MASSASAPPLLVFHGANANAASWMFDVITWSKHFRTYVVDVIGDAGFSAPSRPPLECDRHALWLDDVMRGLALPRAAFVGASLGGWLALDYAVRRPEAVQSLALLCPGGLGAQKNFLLRAFPLLFLGPWGARKMRELVFGPQRGTVPAQLQFFVQFLSLVGSEVRPRRVRIPVLSDAALRGLAIPILAILGGRDVLLDTADAKRRLERLAPHAIVRYLPEARHVIPGQAGAMLEFLLRAGQETRLPGAPQATGRLSSGGLSTRGSHCAHNDTQKQWRGELMKVDRQSMKLRQVLALGAAAAMLCGCTGMSNDRASAPQASGTIFETNITNDLNISSGEPEIAVDPTHPNRLAVIEFAIGSATTPASSFNATAEHDPAKIAASAQYNGRVMLSRDGGRHWIQSGAPPATRPGSAIHGGGDPMIAFGPDGTLYAADEPTPASTSGGGGDLRSLAEYLSHFDVMVAASRDGGIHFDAPQSAGTPADRPWLVVDPSDGMVYTVSSGPLNVKTGQHNIAGPDAPNDRWLIAWQPHLSGKSEPRRLGGPDFSGSGGSTISAAHGIVAATFVLGGPVPGAGFTGSPPAATPVPESLRSIMNGGITSCSMHAPCLFFETSSDRGQHWSRHHVVVPGGFSGQRANVSADPGRPGRYAISVLSPDRTHFLVVVTDDAGVTWSAPVTVPEGASGVDFKQWMAYGPTGVLGLTWRKERLDLTPARQPGAPPENPLFPSTGPAYDIYAAISCDGGATWLPAVRVNAEPSPPGAPGRDDLGYIALDAHSAHLVWGDHRDARRAPAPTPGAIGVIQAYYGRVPFSAVSHGASCGRK